MNKMLTRYIASDLSINISHSIWHTLVHEDIFCKHINQDEFNLIFHIQVLNLNVKV